MTSSTSISIDGRVRWSAITLSDGNRIENGPFWMCVWQQASQLVFVTDGVNAWPITSVVGLEGASWPNA